MLNILMMMKDFGDGPGGAVYQRQFNVFVRHLYKIGAQEVLNELQPDPRNGQLPISSSWDQTFRDWDAGPRITSGMSR